MAKDKHSKNAKPKLAYQAPELVSLGERDTGLGQGCRNGSGATLRCLNGNSAALNCNTGSSAGNNCRNGNSPAGRCNAGTGR